PVPAVLPHDALLDDPAGAAAATHLLDPDADACALVLERPFAGGGRGRGVHRAHCRSANTTRRCDAENRGVQVVSTSVGVRVWSSTDRSDGLSVAVWVT